MVVQMEKVKFIFKMVLIFKETLKWVRRMVWIIFSFILMDLIIEVDLIIRKKMDMECFIIIPNLHMKVHGKMEYLMEKIVRRLMLMVVYIMEILIMELNKETAVIDGLMVKYTKESSKMGL